METLIALVVLGAIALAANYALQDRSIYPLVVAALFMVNALMVVLGVMYLLIAFLSEEENTALGLQDIETLNAAVALAILMVTSLICTALLFRPVRYKIKNWFPARVTSASSAPIDNPPALMMVDGEAVYLPATPPPTLPESVQKLRAMPELIGYDPDSPVHTVALVFCVYLIGQTLANFALVGGLEGISDAISINYLTLFLNFLPQVLIPLIGVGWLMRRSFGQTLQRLGLTDFSLESIAVGIGVAIGLLIMVGVVNVVWISLVPQDIYEEQTEASEALAESIDTFWLVLAVATAAAVGEEIAFRGALQPVFGLWWTAFIFTAIHAQYTLTPAALIIFGVALALGWLRRRYNLYAAIAAHFMYNFIPLLASLADNS